LRIPGHGVLPRGCSRFEREAQVLALLNRANIAAIYGIDPGAIVMELVDGDFRSPPDRNRAGGRTRKRDNPKRSDAGQHQSHAGRRGEAAGFREGSKYSNGPAMVSKQPALRRAIVVTSEGKSSKFVLASA
jgi:hypothetical protein